MNNSRAHRIKVPSGKSSGDILYTPNIYSRQQSHGKYQRVFPDQELKHNKSFDHRNDYEEDRHNEYEQQSTYSRAVSEISDYVRAKGIPSPLKWNPKTRRMIMRK